MDSCSLCQQHPTDAEKQVWFQLAECSAVSSVSFLMKWHTEGAIVIILSATGSYTFDPTEKIVLILRVSLTKPSFANLVPVLGI